MKIKNIMRPRKTIKVKAIVGVKKDQPTAAQGFGPSLVYNGGPLLANVEITPIYWGSAWASDPLQPELDMFFEFAVQSSIIDNLSEYSATGFTIGHGTTIPSIIDGADPATPIDDVDIQAFLQAKIDSGTINPDSNSLYFVFTPSGVTVTLQGSASCQDFCGYHNFFNATDGRPVVYAVIPYPDCVGCEFASTTFDSMTTVASHELSESITDPQFTGWYDPNTGNEIGDICDGNTKVVTTAAPKASQPGVVASPLYNVAVSPTQAAFDGTTPVNLSVTLTPAGSTGGGGGGTPGGPYTIQTEWSNAQGACV